MTAILAMVMGVMAVGGGFLFLFFPVDPDSISARKNQMLANMRSLQQAMAAMAFDRIRTGKDDGVVWTSMRENGKVRSATLRELFAALTDGGYLTEDDLRRLLSARGATPFEGPFLADKIPFWIFRVDEESPADQPVIALKNEEKVFVYLTKGGGGGVKRNPKDAASFPAGRDAEGREYRYETLK